MEVDKRCLGSAIDTDHWLRKPMCKSMHPRRPQPPWSWKGFIIAVARPGIAGLRRLKTPTPQPEEEGNFSHRMMLIKPVTVSMPTSCGSLKSMAK